MTISVRYFASLKDRLGRSNDQLEAQEGLTVAGVWESLHPDLPMPATVLSAVNREYGDPDQIVKDGDEVAFFPPVTGG